MASATPEDLPDLTAQPVREDGREPLLAKPVGLVGLGAMGLPIAGALLRGGHAVLACDSDLARLSLAAELYGDGLHTTPLAVELGERCDLVLLLLPDSAAVAEVTGELAPSLPTGALIADLGWSDPAETRLLAAALQDRGLRLVDAPVLGNPIDAETGKVKFLVGGPLDDVAALQPYLDAMGEGWRHTGPVGSAHEAAQQKK